MKNDILFVSHLRVESTGSEGLLIGCSERPAMNTSGYQSLFDPAIFLYSLAAHRCPCPLVACAVPAPAFFLNNALKMH